MNADELTNLIREDLNRFKAAKLIAHKPPYLMRCFWAFGYHGDWINGPAKICGGADSTMNGGEQLWHDVPEGRAAVYLKENDSALMQFYVEIDTQKLLLVAE